MGGPSEPFTAASSRMPQKLLKQQTPETKLPSSPSGRWSGTQHPPKPVSGMRTHTAKPPLLPPSPHISTVPGWLCPSTRLPPPHLRGWDLRGSLTGSSPSFPTPTQHPSLDHPSQKSGGLRALVPNGHHGNSAISDHYCPIIGLLSLSLSLSLK